MSVEIPVAEFKVRSSDFEQIIDLEETTITIRLTYNTRVDYWFASFSTNQSSIQGVKLTKEYLLLDQYKAMLPDIKGDFIVTRLTNDLDIPELTYDNFGTDWAFQYLTESEVESWKDEREI